MVVALSFRRSLEQQVHACVDGCQRVAQVVTEHRDKLLAERRGFAFVEQVGRSRVHPVDRAQMSADYLREHFEHADGLGRIQPMRFGIDRAKRTEKCTVREPDRHRDIALKAVHRRRVVGAERRIFGDMIDDDGVAALPDFIADRSPNLEFTARLEAERDVVAHVARDPAILGNAGDRSEAHPCCPTHDIEDRGDCLDAVDSGDILVEIVGHGLMNGCGFLFLPTSPQLIGDFEGRAIFRPGLAMIVDPGGGDVGVAEPLLHLGDVGLVVERIGGGRRA